MPIQFGVPVKIASALAVVDNGTPSTSDFTTSSPVSEVSVQAIYLVGFDNGNTVVSLSWSLDGVNYMAAPNLASPVRSGGATGLIALPAPATQFRVSVTSLDNVTSVDLYVLVEANDRL